MEITPFRSDTLHAFLYLDQGPLMIGAAPVSLDEARRLHSWLGKYLRFEESKEARRGLNDVLEQMKPPVQPAEPPMPRDDLPVFHFVYDPRDPDYPQTIGYKPGTVDRHGNDLTPPEIVPPDNPLATHTFTVGEVIEATEADPQLISFLRGNKLFRRALISEIQQAENS